jgi:hypothetical protein
MPYIMFHSASNDGDGLSQVSHQRASLLHLNDITARFWDTLPLCRRHSFMMIVEVDECQV